MRSTGRFPCLPPCWAPCTPCAFFRGPMGSSTQQVKYLASWSFPFLSLEERSTSKYSTGKTLCSLFIYIVCIYIYIYIHIYEIHPLVVGIIYSFFVVVVIVVKGTRQMMINRKRLKLHGEILLMLPAQRQREMARHGTV